MVESIEKNSLVKKIYRIFFILNSKLNKLDNK